MTERPLICAFVKLRNEIIREGNVYRLLENLDHYVDAAVVCDDASADGTYGVLKQWIASKPASDPPRYLMLAVAPESQDFSKELVVKQKMLDVVHGIRPHFVLWMDGDEVFDVNGTRHLRDFCLAMLDSPVDAWAFHYTQFWRDTSFARTDDGFDDGRFYKLWRWTPELKFRVIERTHQPQFPAQVMDAIEQRRTAPAPFEQLHYGNFGTNLRWKCIQYWGGLGGVDRHLLFDAATFRPVDPKIIPEGCEQVTHTIDSEPDDKIIGPRILPPRPFSPAHVERIRSLKNLRGLEETFTVVIPAYNRAKDLPRAIDSLRKQTYDKWIALVLDDGSTDRTYEMMRDVQDSDPRIFYARYLTNRGGVAANEIGMALACEMTEWWTRLGSDDWFGPRKLELDAAALKEHDACYGFYHVARSGELQEMCNGPIPRLLCSRLALSKPYRFVASWANCAVRTSVLRRIARSYGNFCDPRLRNMEDFLINARVVRESSGWAWRGDVAGSIVIDPSEEQAQAIVMAINSGYYTPEFEAAWTASTTGASGNTGVTNRDNELTLELIEQENKR